MAAPSEATTLQDIASLDRFLLSDMTEELVTMTEFCKESFLPALYKLSKGLTDEEHSVATAFRDSHPSVVTRLKSRFPERPQIADLRADKVEDEEILKVQAAEIVRCLGNEYKLMQELRTFFEQVQVTLFKIDDATLDLTFHNAPKLLQLFMGLFCNCTKLLLLASKCDIPFILQLYSVMFSYSTGQDIRDRQELQDFAIACKDPIPWLQGHFFQLWERIARVLDMVACPVLGSLCQSSNISKPNIFDIMSMDAFPMGIAGLSRDLSYTYIQLADDLKDWALLGYLVCPAGLQNPAARELIRDLLAETFKIFIFREVYEWVHLLYESYVQPYMDAMVSTMEVRPNVPRTFSRNLVMSSAQAAYEGAMKDHQLRRIFITQQLNTLLVWFKDSDAGGDVLAKHLNMVLAGMAYARSEILWFVGQHVMLPSEQLPKSWTNKFKIQPSSSSSHMVTDYGIISLLSALEKMYKLLVGCDAVVVQLHHNALELLQTEVMPRTITLFNALQKIPEGRRLFTELKGIIDEVEGVLSVNVHGSSDVLEMKDKMRALETSWMRMTLTLLSKHTTLGAAYLETVARDPGYIQRVQQVVDACSRLVDVEQLLQQHANLQSLSFFSEKMRAIMVHSVDAPPALLADCPDLLQVLHWYEHSLDKYMSSTDYIALAVAHADQHLKEMCRKIREIIHNLARVPALMAYVQQTTEMNMNKPKGFLNRLSGMPSKQADLIASTQLLPNGRQLLQLTALASGMERAGKVVLSGQHIIVPVEYLREALQDAMVDYIDNCARPAGMILPPSLIAAEVQAILYVVSILQDSLRTDIMPCMWEALLQMGAGSLPLLQTVGGPPLDVAPETLQTSLLSYMADWYVEAVVMDARGWGSMYAPQQRAFIQSNPAAPDLTQFTSVAELRCLFQLFGPYAAIQLATRLEAPIQHTMQYLDAVLLQNHAVLSSAFAAFQETGTCIEEIQKAYTDLQPEINVILGNLRVLGHALALRLLISEACLDVLSERTPYLLLAAEAAAQCLGAVESTTDRSISNRHICDALNLPRPATDNYSSPTNADPAAVAVLAGTNNIERYSRWCTLPVLLAVAVAATPHATAVYNPVTRTFANEIQVFPFVVKALTLCQDAASSLMLSSGARFLSAVNQSSAPDMLAAFAHMTSLLLVTRVEHTEIRSTKQLLLEQLQCRDVQRSTLESAWLPASRTLSAYLHCAAGAAMPEVV